MANNYALRSRDAAAMAAQEVFVIMKQIRVTSPYDVDRRITRTIEPA